MENKKPLIINNRYVKEAEKPLHSAKNETGHAPYEATGKKVRITLVKSTIACLEDQIRTVEALGLKKLHQSKVVELNDAISGMLYRVRHLVSVEDIDE